ncbi:hypothetical protein BT63DRAFT_229048 [Microthyrium microscopicum]|uniref:SWI5-dependent HO expression protein 3 n=1 Tax=Microthyrium microscopicum TaxID=703497 RepID=A0A6A6UCU9_9PEZI|nr:hypothetical protein BT63DRAFT_229048 [Microthyrium microscopicum]
MDNLSPIYERSDEDAQGESFNRDRAQRVQHVPTVDRGVPYDISARPDTASSDVEQFRYPAYDRRTTFASAASKEPAPNRGPLVMPPGVVVRGMGPTRTLSANSNASTAPDDRVNLIPEDDRSLRYTPRGSPKPANQNILPDQVKDTEDVAKFHDQGPAKNALANADMDLDNSVEDQTATGLAAFAKADSPLNGNRPESKLRRNGMNTKRTGNRKKKQKKPQLELREIQHSTDLDPGNVQDEPINDANGSKGIRHSPESHEERGYSPQLNPDQQEPFVQEPPHEQGHGLQANAESGHLQEPYQNGVHQEEHPHSHEIHNGNNHGMPIIDSAPDVHQPAVDHDILHQVAASHGQVRVSRKRPKKAPRHSPQPPQPVQKPEPNHVQRACNVMTAVFEAQAQDMENLKTELESKRYELSELCHRYNNLVTVNDDHEMEILDLQQKLDNLELEIPRLSSIAVALEQSTQNHGDLLNSQAELHQLHKAGLQDACSEASLFKPQLEIALVELEKKQAELKELRTQYIELNISINARLRELERENASFQEKLRQKDELLVAEKDKFNKIEERLGSVLLDKESNVESKVQEAETKILNVMSDLQSVLKVVQDGQKPADTIDPNEILSLVKELHSRQYVSVDDFAKVDGLLSSIKGR